MINAPVPALLGEVPEEVVWCVGVSHSSLYPISLFESS